MKPTLHSIDEVIYELEMIITNSELRKSPRGYFAALYRRVTLEIKKGVSELDPSKQIFQDNARMAQLDIVFAKRYIDAFYEFKQKGKISDCWQLSFTNSREYWPIVIQHLLLGMNAHINLDLGIAAAELMKESPIDDLKHDFDKINDILSALVTEVEKDLLAIWPGLIRILKWTRKTDGFLIDFSMKTARDGAWDFACELSETPEDLWQTKIAERDRRITEIAKLITKPGFIVSFVFKIIRLFEKGSVEDKIAKMAKVKLSNELV